MRGFPGDVPRSRGNSTHHEEHEVLGGNPFSRQAAKGAKRAKSRFDTYPISRRVGQPFGLHGTEESYNKNVQV